MKTGNKLFKSNPSYSNIFKKLWIKKINLRRNNSS